jgi:DNA invertase Pin-like site-specific DNA recombinase
MYLRKSRADMDAEAHGEGETLARHERVLIELSRRLNKPVTKIFREVVSGETIIARPEMQKLLSEVEQSIWDGVLVMEVERLARGDTIDQGLVAQTFKYSNTQIITPMKTYDPNNEYDEEYFEFGLFMSRREFKTINRRLQRGRLESVKEGKYVGNRPPYGYTRIKIEHGKGFTLEPIENEAEIVQLIYKLYTYGEIESNGAPKRIGVSLIARKLNEMKVMSKTGKIWTQSTIRDILINPVYNGMIRWNWRPSVKKMVDGHMVKERPRKTDYILTKGIHHAIIDESIWQLAQEYMSHNPSQPIPHRKKVMNPLSGLIICGKCGRKMVRRPLNHTSYKFDYLMCSEPSCSTVSSPLNYVEDRVLQGLEEILNAYKLKWENSESENNIELDIKRKAILKFDVELKNLELQLSNLHDLLEREVYSIDTFLDRSKIISERIKQIKQDLEIINKSIEMDEQRENNKKSIIPKIQTILEVYRTLDDPYQKNVILKDVLDKVIYTKDVAGTKLGGSDNFALTIYPIISSLVEN